MPIYEYQASDAAAAAGCRHCAAPFEVMQRINDAPLTTCPQCGAAVTRLISAPAVGRSQSGFDDRAKAAGFHKLQRLGKGEYEKQY
jgi:putative FmdB family regulatory protein